MRKNTARHWLHAGLDLLPLILIPVFMIYSHRHTMTQQTSVDIQYKYQSNEVNSIDDLIEGNIYYIDALEFTNQNTLQDLDLYFIKFNVVDFTINEINVGETMISHYDSKNGNYLNLYADNNIWYYYFTNSGVYQGIESDFELLITDVVLYTQTVNAFKIWCNTYNILPQYTDYNVIESVEVHDETSSVMNVFMDNFNGAIDKYFNMGNVFGMTNVYQWFNTNIFNGQAPTIIFSVWNIVLYEFVMDLLFLLYALFMWFIDVTKRLIEKPLDSIK